MTLSIKSRRSLGWTGWMAAVAAATMAVLLVSAAAAQATVTLSPTGSYRDRDVVRVTGTVPGAIRTVTDYTVAQCNAAGTLGARCSLTTASRRMAIATYRALGFRLTLHETFSDWDFTTNRAAGTTTTCRSGPLGGTDQCAVVVSFYDTSRGTPVPLGSDSVNITFS
jgi:hypothetical protein